MSTANTSFQSITDNSTASAFRASYPVDFNLYSDDDQPVLYIDDSPQGHNLHLEIVNSSRQTLNFLAGANATPGPDNYHFELKFRAGTLSKTSLSNIALAAPGWTLAKPTPEQNSQPGRAVSLYFLGAARTLNPGDNIKLTLTGVSADGGGGARGTRVELKFRQLTYPGQSTSLNGTRVQHVSIVNQQGKKNIPLHVGFIGPNTILNDGQSPNELTLRITNALEDSSISLTSAGSVRSKFVISFDVQGKAAKDSKGVTKEWALTDAGQVSGILVQVRFRDQDVWKDVKPAAGNQGESPEWIIENDVLEKLDPGQHIQIKLSGIKSSLPSGQTNLYVRYENITGYWDGQFIVAVEKTPVIYQGGNVGISTNKPGEKLEVAGNLKVTGSRIKNSLGLGMLETNKGDWLRVNPDKQYSGTAIYNSVAIGESGGLSVGDWTQMPQGQLRVTQSAFLATNGGNVGIGTTNPSAKLEVNGSIKSPMWKVRELFGNTPGPLPITSPKFRTEGGTLLIIATGSAFRLNRGVTGIDINVDGKYKGSATAFNEGPGGAFNVPPRPYRMTLCNSIIATNVPAGEHTLTIAVFSDAPDTKTDSNDIFNVTVLELPF